MKVSQAIRAVLSEAIGDPKVHVVGEALELSPATTGLMAEAPDQVHLLPAADASLVGVAMGLAMSGKTVVVELADTASVWAAAQQLGQEAEALARASEFRATIVVRIPWAPGRPDPSEVLLAMPGIRLAAAGRPEDAPALLRSALRGPGVTVLLEPGAVGTRAIRGEGEAEIGKVSVARAGSHATALCWAAGVQAALDAADTLAGEGIDLEVIDLTSLSPLDDDGIGAHVQQTGRPVLVGAPASLLGSVVDAAFLRLESPPAVLAANADDIVAGVRASIRY